MTLPTLNVRELKRLAFDCAYEETGGDLTAVAARLGVAVKTAYNLAHEYQRRLRQPGKGPRAKAEA